MSNRLALGVIFWLWESWTSNCLIIKCFLEWEKLRVTSLRASFLRLLFLPIPAMHDWSIFAPLIRSYGFVSFLSLQPWGSTSPLLTSSPRASEEKSATLRNQFLIHSNCCDAFEWSITLGVCDMAKHRLSKNPRPDSPAPSEIIALANVQILS